MTISRYFVNILSISYENRKSDIAASLPAIYQLQKNKLSDQTTANIQTFSSQLFIVLYACETWQVI